LFAFFCLLLPRFLFVDQKPLSLFSFICLFFSSCLRNLVKNTTFVRVVARSLSLSDKKKKKKKKVKSKLKK